MYKVFLCTGSEPMKMGKLKQKKACHFIFSKKKKKKSPACGRARPAPFLHHSQE